ncbi:MAG: response regulator [Alphaproteobacteria bacterium]|jgi:two-component system, sensor histidine kinase|nr:response regulator [Alphaproteobacteria bacterium]MBU2040752.1 response regulator [Alphaproteobacteria bacterium]MBU2125175.1 response regulator [Alphaproteobacteria bacterium]MBU2396546.1 response regulator [Alphaproteobacteria bacterium]
MARIGDFASAALPIGPDTPGAEVFDRFQREPDTLIIAVVDSDQRPVGLIERNAFTLKMAAEFGRALYAKRPAATFMDAAPRILDADADAETLFQSMDDANLGGLLNGFVVTSAGLYFGVGAGVHVLQAGNAIHRRRAEAMGALARDLARAEAEARASSRAKSEFLAVMSHEIRTPLNGVLGVAALMERELTQEAMRPYARTILDSGQSLLRLLTDALDMSRAEAGLMTFETAPVQIAAVAADLKALWSPRAQEKNLTLTVTHDTAGHDWVAGDEMRLKQLFNNLIGNALKFTQAGEVAVHIASVEIDGAIAITATIDDSGPGVPTDAAGTIFDPFNTGHAGREGAGAGLGLAICRQIVELMSGSIAVERSPQGGARFRFSLSLPGATREMRAAAMQMAEPTDHATLHVLVVDDNATNRFVAAKVLELFGCSSEAVEDGQAAVERVQTGAFDLILMDIKMPVMDGVQATRAIRALRGPVAEIPILALTANADPRDESEYLAAGMNGVAQKPIQPDALLHAIRLVMGGGAVEHAPVTKAA